MFLGYHGNQWNDVTIALNENGISIHNYWYMDLTIIKVVNSYIYIYIYIPLYFMHAKLFSRPIPGVVEMP